MKLYFFLFVFSCYFDDCFCFLRYSMDDKKSRKRVNEDSRSRGRPAKKPRGRVNAGRKRHGQATENVSERTVYRRAHELLNSPEYDIRVIQLAATLSHKKKENENESGEPAQDNLSINRHTGESAAAFYLENNYTVSQYKALVNDSISRNSKIYPAYEIVSKAMTESLPNVEAKSETEFIVPLQDMLNKSAERLCERVALEWCEDDLNCLLLTTTLGFDSSSGHGNPHQKYADSSNENVNPQQSLFVTSIIVISLTSSRSGGSSWTNPTPQSIRFCRPLRLAHEKEDDETSTKEYERLSQEKKLLTSHRFKMSNKKPVKVVFHVYETLFDGKCLNTIVGNKASSRCPICKLTAHSFKNFNYEVFKPNDSALHYGLGLLHCEINIFEHFLKLSYRNFQAESWDMTKSIKSKFISLIIKII